MRDVLRSRRDGLDLDLVGEGAVILPRRGEEEGEECGEEGDCSGALVVWSRPKVAMSSTNEGRAVIIRVWEDEGIGSGRATLGGKR